MFKFKVFLLSLMMTSCVFAVDPEGTNENMPPEGSSARQSLPDAPQESHVVLSNGIRMTQSTFDRMITSGKLSRRKSFMLVAPEVDNGREAFIPRLEGGPAHSAKRDANCLTPDPIDPSGSGEVKRRKTVKSHFQIPQPKDPNSIGSLIVRRGETAYHLHMLAETGFSATVEEGEAAGRPMTREEFVSVANGLTGAFRKWKEPHVLADEYRGIFEILLYQAGAEKETDPEKQLETPDAVDQALDAIASYLQGKERLAA